MSDCEAVRNPGRCNRPKSETVLTGRSGQTLFTIEQIYLFLDHFAEDFSFLEG